MSTPQYSGKRLVTFTSAPAAGANTGCLLLIGAAAPYSLFYDNGSALVPLDLQGDWVGRTVMNADGVTAANDNVVFMNNASTQAFTVNATPAFGLNKLLELIPIGAGAVTLTANTGAGVTFEGLNFSGSSIVITRPVSLIQRALNTWRVIGVPDIKYQIKVNCSNNVGAGFTTITINSTAFNKGGFVVNGDSTVTIPATGLYDCTGTLRGDDNASPRNVGMGIGTSNADSGDFYWDINAQTGSGYNRKTCQYHNIIAFNAGDYVRLFAYVDSGTMNLSGQMVLNKIG